MHFRVDVYHYFDWIVSGVYNPDIDTGHNSPSSLQKYSFSIFFIFFIYLFILSQPQNSIATIIFDGSRVIDQLIYVIMQNFGQNINADILTESNNNLSPI